MNSSSCCEDDCGVGEQMSCRGRFPTHCLEEQSVHMKISLSVIDLPLDDLILLNNEAYLVPQLCSKFLCTQAIKGVLCGSGRVIPVEK